MTQALNLANFANNLNTAGATSNAGLQNSSVTVTAGTGMSGGGAVALGSSVTLTNAGVTSVAAGSGISVSGSTGGVTITNTQPFSGSTSQLVKAWVYFASYPSIVIYNSYNISSITNPSAGVCIINFTNPMPNANYVILGSGNTPSVANGTFQPVYSSGTPPTTTSVQILTTTLSGYASNLTNIYVAILGT